MLDYYRGNAGRIFLNRQIWLLVAGAMMLCAVFGDGRVDLEIDRWFYDDAVNLFPLANQWLLKAVLHDGARILSATGALMLCVITAAAWATRSSCLRPYRSELLFAATAALIAVLAVGVLKHYSSHACPWDLARFGGTAAYHPLLGTRPAGPLLPGCFPAAHPLSGYVWLAGPLAVPTRTASRPPCWQLAFLLGTVFGTVQVIRGAHFASHVLWTAWVTWAVDIALLTAYAELVNRVSAARPISSRAAVQPLSNAEGPRS